MTFLKHCLSKINKYFNAIEYYIKQLFIPPYQQAPAAGLPYPDSLCCLLHQLHFLPPPFYTILKPGFRQPILFFLDLDIILKPINCFFQTFFQLDLGFPVQQLLGFCYIRHSNFWIVLRKRIKNNPAFGISQQFYFFC
jgi:hypothetical protein